MNNTNLILSDESEKMKNRELLEEYFSHSLEIDLLLRLYPDDEDGLRCDMLNFFIGIAFFEAGAFFGFFVAALMQAARSGEIGLNGKEDSYGREHSVGAENCTGTVSAAGRDQ